MSKRKFKHLKKFESFNEYDKLNEGKVSTAALLTALQLAGTFFGSQATAQSGDAISLSDAVKQMQSSPVVNDARFSMAIGKASAPNADKDGTIPRSQETKHYAYYNGGDISKLLSSEQKSDSHYFKGTKQDLIDAIKSGKIENVFKNFENISAEEAGVSKITKDSKGVDVTDYLKIGDKEILGEGKLVFSLRDGNKEIIVSGNGLYSLVRVVKASIDKGMPHLAMCELGVKEGDVSFIQEAYVQTNFSQVMSGFFTANYYMFEMGTGFGDMDGVASENSVASKFKIADLKGKSHDQIADRIYEVTNGFISDFIIEDAEMKVNVVTKERIKEYLKKFDDAYEECFTQKEMRRPGHYSYEEKSEMATEKFKSIYKEFIEEVTNTYLANLSDYVNFVSGYENAGADSDVKLLVEALRSISNEVKQKESSIKFTQQYSGRDVHVYNAKTSKEVKRTSGFQKAEKGDESGAPGRIGESKSFKHLKRFKF